MARFGIATLDRSPLLGFEPDLAGWATAAADAGFEAIGFDVFALRVDDLDTVAQRVATTGMTVGDLAGLNIGPDDALVDTALAELDGWCARLHPEWVPVKVDVAPDARVVSWLAEASKLFGRHGARLGIEPSGTSPIGSIADAVGLLDRLADPAAGVVVDTWHFGRRPEWEALAALGDRLAYVQVSDAVPPVDDDAIHETMHRRALPGFGNLDLARFVATVRGAGFDGLVMAEVLSETERRTPLADHVRRVHEALTATWTRA